MIQPCRTAQINGQPAIRTNGPDSGLESGDRMLLGTQLCMPRRRSDAHQLSALHMLNSATVGERVGSLYSTRATIRFRHPHPM